MTEQLRVKCSHSIRCMCNFNGVTVCNGNIEICIYRKENKERLRLGGKVNDKMNDTTTAIRLVCENLSFFVEHKNNNYGNSALEPLRIFSKSDSENQLYDRIDDKLSRIKNSNEFRKNDIVDLMGYLVLLCIKKGWMSFKDLID